MGRWKSIWFKRTLAAAATAWLWMLPLGTATAGEPRFVRQGIVCEAPAEDGAEWEVLLEGRPLASESIHLADGRRWMMFTWRPATSYTLRRGSSLISITAPAKPAPLRLRTIELEDVSQAAAAEVAPDTVVKFAPDSRRLAIGTFGGWLRVVDVYSGRMLHQQRVAEGMVKRLAWSPDGRQLYVGEQSPDANLFALDAGDATTPGTFERLWSLRLADQIETSQPGANDRYGIYSLPAVFDLKVSGDGRIFAAGLHSWNTGGQLQNRWQLVCLDPAGKPVWRFPAEKAAPLSMNSFGLDAGGRRLAFFAHQTQAPVPNQPLIPGTLYALDARTGTIEGQHRFTPEKQFARVESWDSIGVSPAADRVAIGLQDGRAFLFAAGKDGLAVKKQLDLGRPLVVGSIPVVAAVSYTRIFGDRIFLQTQNTHIPFGSAQTAQQAPAAHRGANMLSVADLDGNRAWLYRGPFSLSGSWTDAANRWLLVTCRELPGALEPSQFGCLLFDLQAPGGGSAKLVYHYPTAAPVIFDADLSPDGRLIALVEIPYLQANRRDLKGNYQVHVVH